MPPGPCVFAPPPPCRSFIFKTYATSPAACRLLFFSQQLPQEQLERYRDRLAAGGRLTIFDSRAAVRENEVPPAPPQGWHQLLPQHVFVGRGGEDALVDDVAAQEVAAYFDMRARVTWEGLAHDCMLDAGWQEAAEALHLWLGTLAPLHTPVRQG